MEIIDEGLAQIDVPGQITAPAHTLYEIVRKLPDGADVSLSFSGDDPRLVIQAGRSRFNLPVLPAGDFPVMSSDGLSGRVPVDTNDLIRLIDKTRFAISTEETRYYLNGLYSTRSTTAARSSCAPWPPTATAWPWPRCRPPRARPACPA
jgi:DNA polymerase-3 subunit beta